MTAPPSPLPIPCNAGSGEEPQRVRELAALFAVSAAINQSITETDALDAALRQVLQVLCLDSGRIYLFDEATGEYSLATRAGDPTLLDPSKTEMVPGECLCGFVGYAAATWRGGDHHPQPAGRRRRVPSSFRAERVRRGAAAGARANARRAARGSTDARGARRARDGVAAVRRHANRLCA